MDITSPIVLTSQLAMEQQMDVLANNIANLSTPAFKGQRIDFSQLVSTRGGRSTSYAHTTGTSTDFSQGPLLHSDNALDVALDGDGFLQVETPAGTEYTRNGTLQLDAENQLVTRQGYPVLDAAGQPIVIPPGSGRIAIGQDGTVSNGRGTIAQIPVVTFPQLQALAPAEGGFFITDQTPQPAIGTRVMQGMIEGSNVQAILEMTHLMAIARAAGGTKDYVNQQATLRQNAITQLGKVV
jgi:flagellar basal-body rod protein FlgF